MTEIFSNINPEVKEVAQMAWRLACAQKDPLKAAEFLDTIIRYYKNIYTNNEIEFLQFYFQMQMEMIKNE